MWLCSLCSEESAEADPNCGRNTRHGAHLRAGPARHCGSTDPPTTLHRFSFFHRSLLIAFPAAQVFLNPLRSALSGPCPVIDTQSLTQVHPHTTRATAHAYELLTLCVCVVCLCGVSTDILDCGSAPGCESGAAEESRAAVQALVAAPDHRRRVPPDGACWLSLLTRPSGHAIAGALMCGVCGVCGEKKNRVHI